ncbi:tRNA(Met) cytidine acetyltransferase TmcA [Salinibaculum rarum]|uniref:tRNA(Met) cytidine acetyltransferase TmcA n=1 Tax=Salinibaculum rarum TaxID=3058903 RepID=UPI00265F7290|nr:tRNA(Met) cytidine acetyltransferase TmcA [Salinibaculum sp. KK48]
MDYAARLRENARVHDERRVLVLAGPPEATRDRAAVALDVAAIPAAETRYVGRADTTPWDPIDPKRADQLLGTTQQAVVLDTHDACQPNALGCTLGAVGGGGLLVLLTPPLEEWPNRRDDFDESLAVPPFERDQVIGYFRRRLVWTLRQHRGIAIVDAEDGTVEKDGIIDAAPRLGHADPDPPSDCAFPTASYTACRTDDQRDAIAAFERLVESGHALVVEADRGRGKSSAAGLAAGSLALADNDVLVTAPQYRAASEVFARARELLTEIGELACRDSDRNPHRIETETGCVRFVPAADATALPGDPDCVIVDEAAALPVRRLRAFLDADSVAFTTTIHGYEGAGRGFSVRFRDDLAESDHTVHDQHLGTPIRYAPGDPVEVWGFRALCLDARPAVDPLVTDATPETVSYRRLSSADLLDDEHLLREVFGLLVLAHYRTEPNDLARLLDAPNVTIRALCLDGHIVAVALLAREGNLSAARRARMYEGERVRGNMIPDVLTSQLRDERAGVPVGYRVLRIATHPAVRSRGLGSRLLAAVREEVGDDVDWLGVGYGATPELLSFWTQNGFSTVHLSVTRNDRSGEHSAVMLDPLSEAGRTLHDRHAEWFVGRLSGMLTDALSEVDPDVVRATLDSLDASVPLELSDWEWRVAAGIATGTAILETAPRPVGRLALRHLVDSTDPDTLAARQERLLVRRVLQRQSWDTVAEELDYHSTAACKRRLPDAVRPLVSAFGGARVHEELERFE